MVYPIKTLSQLPLVLKGFRKERGLTQAAMAEKLGITQQSYAHFEANPATATLERVFTVLRLLDVEISLDQTGHTDKQAATPSPKPASPVAVRQAKPAAATKARKPPVPARKKESW